MSNFASDRHALYCGWVVGQLMKEHGLPVTPMTDDNDDYIPQLLLLIGGEEITLVIPEPSKDWDL
jgi:hypothetical protein